VLHPGVALPVGTALASMHNGLSNVAVARGAALRAHTIDIERAGLPLQRHADLRAVQWGKLLLNLNNPVNALSGRPLREPLMDRGCRQCLAALQTEAMQLLRGQGITPAQVTALPPHRVPTLLRIDAKARSR
jgi:2-dehydropantoate 2-reductase